MLTTSGQHLALSSVRASGGRSCGHQAAVRRGLLVRTDRSSPPERCHEPSCWGQLLRNPLQRCCRLLPRLRPSQTGRFKWAAELPPVLRADWDQPVPAQRQGCASGAGGEEVMALGRSTLPAAGTHRARRHFLSRALLCVVESALATDYGLPNRWGLQSQVPTRQARKVEGNLVNIIGTRQVFFSIFIYVQRLAHSFQMPGMYCSLEELQYPAVFNVKGKPFH